MRKANVRRLRNDMIHFLKYWQEKKLRRPTELHARAHAITSLM